MEKTEYGRDVLKLIDHSEVKEDIQVDQQSLILDLSVNFPQAKINDQIFQKFNTSKVVDLDSLKFENGGHLMSN